MRAVKAKFDGQRIETPPELEGASPTEVLVVFEEDGAKQGSVEGSAWDVIGKAPRPRTRQDIESQLQKDRDEWDR